MFTVCDDVPVITLDKSCIFHENVSWLLQSALDATGKADSLYEYIDDAKIFSEARRYGFPKEEVSVVRLKAKELRHIRAVGTNGKRSVMLSVVVALAMHAPPGAMDALGKELRDYKLDKAFAHLLESGGVGRAMESLCSEGARPRRSRDADWGGGGSGGGGGDWEAPQRSRAPATDGAPRAPRKPRAPPQPPDGVEVQIVCGMVPVLDMDKRSVFHENVSWLMQASMACGGKADSFFEYCEDRDCMNACRALGLNDQEIGLVQFKRKDLSHVKAVGTQGKRSMILAAVVALVLHNDVQCDDLQTELWEYDRSLYKPFDDLIRYAKSLCKDRPPQVIDLPGEGPRGSKRSKPSYAEEDWSQYWVDPKPKRPAGAIKKSDGEPDVRDLDKQLDAYFGS